jgi:hypothetical protein
MDAATARALGYNVGRAGKSLVDAEWAFSEALDDDFDGDVEVLCEAVRAGYDAGWLDLRATEWEQRYTTAPESYDGFGTVTVEVVGSFLEKPVRRVAIDPAHVQWQHDRYFSGIYTCWTEEQYIEHRDLVGFEAA